VTPSLWTVVQTGSGVMDPRRSGVRLCRPVASLWGRLVSRDRSLPLCTWPFRTDLGVVLPEHKGAPLEPRAGRAGTRWQQGDGSAPAGEVSWSGEPRRANLVRARWYAGSGPSDRGIDATGSGMDGARRRVGPSTSGVRADPTTLW